MAILLPIAAAFECKARACDERKQLYAYNRVEQIHECLLGCLVHDVEAKVQTVIVHSEFVPLKNVLQLVALVALVPVLHLWGVVRAF